MANPQIPPTASAPVSPILAKLPIGQIDPNNKDFVLPTVQFIKMYQQLWASVAGTGGLIPDTSVISQLALAPPYEYSSAADEALFAFLATLQIPADPVVTGYSNYVPQDGGADVYPPFQPKDAIPNSQPYTPTITYATPGDLTVAYSAQECRYSVLGDAVLINLRIGFTPTFTTASGELRISLPVTAGAYPNNSIISADPGVVLWGAGTMVEGNIVNTTRYATLHSLQSGVADIALGAAHYLTGVAYGVKLSGCYFKG